MSVDWMSDSAHGGHRLCPIGSSIARPKNACTQQSVHVFVSDCIFALGYRERVLELDRQHATAPIYAPRAVDADPLREKDGPEARSRH